MKKICKNCKHWTTDNTYGYDGMIGTCDSDKFVYSYSMTYLDESNRDMLMVSDYEGYMADFCTGEEFGCIHFEEKENSDEKKEM